MKLRILFLLLLTAASLLVVVNNDSQEVPTIKVAHAQDGDACVQLVQQALTDTSLHCAGLGLNGVCSGSGQTSVKSAQGDSVAIGNPGDYFNLADIQNIETSSADGYNVVLANMQGFFNDKIVMLLLGDVNLQHATGEAVAQEAIQVFNLTTHNSSECGSVLPSSMVLQSTPGMEFEVIVNGAHIRAGSTVFVRTTSDDNMRVSVGQGTAIIFPNTVNEIVVPAGYQVDIPLDENGQAYNLWAHWDIAQDELVLFEPLERLSANVLNGPYSGPTFFQGSGVGNPPPVVVPPVEVPPVPVPFPVPGVTPGPRGQDLPEDVAFVGLEVGGPSCLPTIVFNNDSDDDWDLYRLDTTLGNLSNGERDDIQPTLSQDYQWVAFTSNRVSVPNWEIYIVDRDGENLQRVTYNTGKDINPVWGPNGEIIFESDRDGNWELYWVDVTDSRSLTRLTEDDEGTSASDINAFWADDHTIYFQSDRDGDYEIYKLDLNTQEVTQVTDNNVEDSYPIVSNDGATLAWLQESAAGNLDVWMMDIESGETEQLTDTGTNVFGIAFDPNDEFIAFNTNLGTGNDVFVVTLEADADGTYLVKNLTDDPSTDADDEYEDISPAFRCNSQNVVFHSDRVNEQDDLYEVNPLPLTSGFRAPTRLTFSEDDFDIFPLGDPREEVNSRLNQLP